MAEVPELIVEVHYTKVRTSLAYRGVYPPFMYRTWSAEATRFLNDMAESLVHRRVRWPRV